MRDILFRGKRKDGVWFEGSLLQYKVETPSKTETHYKIQKFNYCYNDENEIYCACMSGFDEEVIPETIGQYTGLTDKNGKKIFEGDYWLDTDGDYLVYVVEFRNAQFCFVCYGTKGALMEYGYDENAGGFGEIDCNPINDFHLSTIEVIGNIHDNPELLKGVEE